MRCSICRGWVGLRADVCACGFVFATRDVTVAIQRARADLWHGRKLQLLGLAGIGGCILLLLLPPRAEVSLDWNADRFWCLVYLTPPMAAIYGLGRGTWLRHDARQRLSISMEMQRLPSARVVVRDRSS